MQTTWPYVRPSAMAKSQASFSGQLARALLSQSLAQGSARWEVTDIAKMTHSLPSGSPLIQHRHVDEDGDIMSTKGMLTLWEAPKSWLVTCWCLEWRPVPRGLMVLDWKRWYEANSIHCQDKVRLSLRKLPFHTPAHSFYLATVFIMSLKQRKIQGHVLHSFVIPL